MIYRLEHPKPQFERDNWCNLNGIWQFEKDPAVSGAERELFKCDKEFSLKINVPFCLESKLSGIGERDFINSVWYKKQFNITKEQLTGRVFIHFGAVDYEAILYINEKTVGVHKGGYSSFCFEITEYLNEGENTVVLNAKDDTRSRLMPSGKQSGRFQSYGCYYTRTTGIWQTVWLEFTPKNYIKKVKYNWDLDSTTLNVQAFVEGKENLTVKASFDGKDMGEASVYCNSDIAYLTLNLKEKHLWEIGKGGLYDLELNYGEDRVKSYFGLRSIEYKDKKFYLNGKSVFQRLVLDQGFYPDGIYTAPSDKDLERDIDLSISMGFNGARLHEKVFEERFLYHADKKGYIVWGEHANWGLDVAYEDSVYGFLPEWLEIVDRDINHPSIVGWCPFNETWDSDKGKQFDGVLDLVWRVTKSADPTRPCIDTSGNFHVITDIYDLHDYSQNPEEFKKHYENLKDGGPFEFFSAFNDRQKYDGKMPFFVSEYGGIAWSQNEKGWGYGNAPKTEEEFLSRLKGLNDVLLDNPNMFGFCYTQLTDVEQEQNGLFTFDRKAKFPPEKIYPLFARKAAIED